MLRLPFRLNDFTRYAWVSDEAQAVWAPRMAEVARWLTRLEINSVLAGLRKCALKEVESPRVAEYSRELAADGLVAIPIEYNGAWTHPYLSESIPYSGTGPYIVRLAIGRRNNAEALQGAWLAKDNLQIGELLGYPTCCSKFFERVWVVEKWVDTTWPMALGTADASVAEHTISVSGSPEANILWRWSGVRMVPHLPCSFDCSQTVKYGRDLWQLAAAAPSREWLYEILEWPVEWSCLHGIAIIRTPILKTVTRTDATAFRYTVRRHGNAFPKNGKRDLGFIYDQRAHSARLAFSR